MLGVGNRLGRVAGADDRQRRHIERAHEGRVVGLDQAGLDGSQELDERAELATVPPGRQEPAHLAVEDGERDAIPGEERRVGEIEKLGDHYEERLTEAGFFFPEDKAASMKLNLRNMWSRMPLTRADVQMLHGMMRQMVRWKDRD